MKQQDPLHVSNYQTQKVQREFTKLRVDVKWRLIPDAVNASLNLV